MLSKRFVPALVTCVLLVAVAGAWRLHSFNEQRAIAEFQDHQLHAVDVIAATLHAELTGMARALRTLGAAIARESDLTAYRELLDTQTECAHAPCFTGLALYDTRGVPLHVTRRPPAIAAEDLMSLAGNAAVRTYVSSSGEPSLVLAVPVESSRGGERRVSGLLAAEVVFDGLLGGPGKSAQFPPVPTLVFDGRGNVVFRSSRPEMRLNNVGRAGQSCTSCHESFDHVRRILTMPRGVLRYNLRGAPQLGAVAPFEFEGERWVVAQVAPLGSAIGVLSVEFRQLALLMVGTVVALGLTAQTGWAQRRRRLEAEADAVHHEHLERGHAELTALNAKLEHAAMEWRTTVDTIDAALMVLDPSGRIRRMNQAASDTLPGEPFEWLGRSCEELKAHPPWDSALALAREARESQTASSARVHYTAAGKTWDLWCRTSRDRSSVVVVARDATALVELQQSLRHSETMAALGSVVVGVAHEVRNPLFAISSLVDAWSVQRRRDPSPFIDALRREVGRVNTLMTELLEYGRPTQVVLQPAPLEKVIDDALRACAPEAQHRGVRIVATPMPDVEVWMDERRLSRVFINLIQNAVQHAPAESLVTVAGATHPTARPRFVLVSVRDRGCGFAEADLPQVFTPFFSRRVGGFGLGLAMSQRIAAEHRGTITAANHPEGGAVVTVTLPLSPPERPIRVCEGAESC
ncbi:MAG TPA: ATP-binding protein [Vicinamibacterales bacterium]|nr:ATP-binding protein [Vicinamibacterales bacterium]